MRKNTKRLVAGSLAVVILGAIYAGVTHLPQPQDAERPSVELVSMETTDLSQVQITNGAEAYTLQCTHTDGKTTYSMAGTDAAAYSENLLQELAEQACSISGQQIAENVKNLDDYGLSDETRTVEITDTDDNSTVLILGTSNQMLGGMYCRVAGDDTTVYLLDSNTAEALTQAQSYYRNLTVLGSYFSLSSELQSLHIDSMADGTSVTIQARDTSGMDETIADSYSSFVFTQPISCDADDNQLSTGVLSDLQDALTAQAVVEDNPADLGEYGLKNPTARLHLTTSSLDATVLVGDTDGDGGIYLMKEGDSTVFLSSASSFDFLQKDWNDWRSTNLMPCALRELSQITVKQGDTIHTVVITHTEGEDDEIDNTATLDGKDMTDNALQQLYLAISSVNFIRLVDDPEDKQPDVTITLTMTDDTTRSLAFAKGGSREYLVQVDHGMFEYGVGQDDLISILNALTTGAAQENSDES